MCSILKLLDLYRISSHVISGETLKNRLPCKIRGMCQQAWRIYLAAFRIRILPDPNYFPGSGSDLWFYRACH